MKQQMIKTAGLLALGMAVVSPVMAAGNGATATPRFVVEPHWAGLQLGVADVDVDGGDLDVGENYILEAGRWLNTNLGVELGVSAVRDAREADADNRGSYRLNLETDEAFVGARLSTSHFNPLRYYASGGLLHSRVHVEVEEEFFDLKPGGRAEDSNDSLGFYLAGGVSYALANRSDVSLQLRYRHRPDAVQTYAGDRDVTDMSVNLGAAFRF